ncbi:MAG: TonB-dependent receptor [Bacteroidota bacterium]
MKKIFFVLAAVIIGSQLQAQDSTSRFLDEVVMTASKNSQKQTETGKVLTIISRQQLEKSPGKTLGEILNTTVGTTIIGSNNVPGTNQTVSIRGSSAGNVLILINGIPLNDPSVITNYFDLNFFSVDQIERIEILKGGQSTLYGSDAVSAVVNIITRAIEKTMRVNGNFTAGSYNTLKQSVGMGKYGNKAGFTLNYTHLSSDGFSAAYDKNKTGTFDKDGLDQHAINAGLLFNITKKLKAGLSGTYSYYKTDLDAAAFTDEKDYTVKNNNKQAGAGLTYSLSKGVIKLNYLFNRTERNYLDDSIHKSSPYVDYSRSNYTGRSHFAELYGNWKTKQMELLAGIDYRLSNTEQDYFSTGPFGPYAPPVLHAEMNQLSPYASVLYKNENGFNAELGGRWNKHSEYGSNFTFTFNPFYLIETKAKIYGNLYSAFKTPTLYQLFDPSAGNKGLSPEKGLIAELGAEIFLVKNCWARLTMFYRNTKDAIIYTFNPSNFSSLYLNAAKQTNYGAELEVKYTAGKVTATGNYTYTGGKTTAYFDGTGTPIAKDTTYFNLYRIPKNAFNINVGVQTTKTIFYSIALHSVSKREEFIYGAKPEMMKAYFTVDVYGEYKFGKAAKLFLDLKNITGQQYFDILGYNSLKFNFTIGFSFQL